MLLVLAILFTAGCAVTKMAGTSTPSPAPAAGNLSVSALTVNFGSVPLGNTKSTSVTLSNNATQTATVQVSQVTISGQGFRLTGVALPTSLAPGHSFTLTIDFTPSAAGNATGTVAIKSTAATAHISVALSGNGMASGQLAVNPANMTFPSVAVGTSQNQSGTLTAGSSPITVSSATWQGTGFSLSGITFPVTIQSGQSVFYRDFCAASCWNDLGRDFVREQCEQLAGKRESGRNGPASSPAQCGPELESGRLRGARLLRLPRQSDRWTL